MVKWIGKLDIYVGQELARTETIESVSRKQYWFLANKRKAELDKQGFMDVWIRNPGIKKEGQGKLF